MVAAADRHAYSVGIRPHGSVPADGDDCACDASRAPRWHRGAVGVARCPRRQHRHRGPAGRGGAGRLVRAAVRVAYAAAADARAPDGAAGASGRVSIPPCKVRGGGACRRGAGPDLCTSPAVSLAPAPCARPHARTPRGALSAARGLKRSAPAVRPRPVGSAPRRRGAGNRRRPHRGRASGTPPHAGVGARSGHPTGEMITARVW